MNIINLNTRHSGNWINASETKPELLEDGSLGIENAEWRTNGGSASISTITAVDTEYLTSVLVGYRYNGKYSGGSQYWQHYKSGKRVGWKSLDDGERMLILDAYYSNIIPAWAKQPGKLVKDYLKPGETKRLEIDEQGTIYGYKYLGVTSDGMLFSPQRIGCVWINRSLQSDIEPSDNNSSGIYAMKNKKSKSLEAYNKPGRVLVRMALSGTVVEANEGLRAQYAQIVEILS